MNTSITKNLLLIRHADAKHDIKRSDFERKLSSLGEHEATIMSQRLLNYGKITPELILCSPARRTIQTGKIFSENDALLFSKIQPENMIYEASAGTLLSLINHVDNKYNNVALIGHNPGLSEIIDYLSDSFIGDIPTSGIVHLKFDVADWASIEAGSGHVAWKAFP